MWIIILIGFLIGIFIAILTAGVVEGFSIKSQVLDFAEGETPVNKTVRDEYGNVVTTGYYLRHMGWTNGHREYIKNIL